MLLTCTNQHMAVCLLRVFMPWDCHKKERKHLGDCSRRNCSRSMVLEAVHDDGLWMFTATVWTSLEPWACSRSGRWSWKFAFCFCFFCWSSKTLDLGRGMTFACVKGRWVFCFLQANCCNVGIFPQTTQVKSLSFAWWLLLWSFTRTLGVVFDVDESARTWNCPSR